MGRHPVVIVEGLGKRFRYYHADRPTTIMEAALAGWRRMQPVDTFWALQDISFTVAKGQMLGVLGHNGAGKSTLLQLIGRVGRPDAGCIETRGRIGALLDLGAGFHTDLTGRENLFVTAISAGMTHREVQQRMASIVEFAELEAFIDSPLRTYSTGMQMRLAFAVAVHTSPDILLIDEHLSVGDLAFQTKCLDRIMQLKNDGCAIILISQSAEPIQTLCDQALWLDQGKMVAWGDPHAIASRYTSKMDAKSLPKPHQTYSREIEIVNAACLDEQQRPTARLRPGEPLTIEISYRAHQLLADCIFVISISNDAGEIFLNTHSATAGVSVPAKLGEGKIRLYLKRLDLSGGDYFVNVGIFNHNWEKTFDYHWHQYPLEIQRAFYEESILAPPRHWEIVNPSKSIHHSQLVK